MSTADPEIPITPGNSIQPGKDHPEASQAIYPPINQALTQMGISGENIQPPQTQPPLTQTALDQVMQKPTMEERAAEILDPGTENRENTVQAIEAFLPGPAKPGTVPSKPFLDLKAALVKKREEAGLKKAA